MMLKLSLIVSLLYATTFYPPNTEDQSIEIKIVGIRSENGQVVIAVFTDEESFKEDNDYLRKKFPKTNISDGEMTIHLDLPPGTYGISLLDDENSDNEMNYNLVGMPKEGFGFADYYHSSLSRPQFEDFEFSLEENETRQMVIKIRYL